MADAQIKAVVTAEDRASRTIAGVGASFGKMSGAVAIGTLAAHGIESAFHGVVAGIKSVITSADESDKVVSQLGAVLKSTGGVAGVTSDSAQRLASSLQKTTTFSDEAVLSAENLLLTFTNIGKDKFPDATKAVLDMSTALGQDTKSSAIQLGKALQDPILGITALRRVGVAFSDDQQKVIKRLVETNHLGEAQAMILKEIQKEFGGSAEAAGKTFSGSLKRLNNQIDDVKEGLGRAIINGITPFMQSLATFVSSDKFREWADKATQDLTNFIKAVSTFLIQHKDAIIQAFKILGETIKITFTILKDVVTFIWNNKDVFVPLTVGILGAIAAVKIFQGVMVMSQAISNVISLGATISSFVASSVTQFGVMGAAKIALDAVISTPMVLALSVAAALALIAYVMVKIAEMRGAVEGFENSLKVAQTTADKLKESTDKLTDPVRQAKLRAFLNEPMPKAAPATGAEKALITVGTFLNKIFKATGGSVMPNTPYVVGEQGPEMFVPTQSGRIIPNSQMGSTANIAINIAPSIGIYAGTPMERRKLAEQILDDMRDVASSKGISLAGLVAR